MHRGKVGIGGYFLSCHRCFFIRRQCGGRKARLVEFERTRRWLFEPNPECGDEVGFGVRVLVVGECPPRAHSHVEHHTPARASRAPRICGARGCARRRPAARRSARTPSSSSAPWACRWSSCSQRTRAWSATRPGRARVNAAVSFNFNDRESVRSADERMVGDVRSSELTSGRSAARPPDRTSLRSTHLALRAWRVRR